MSGNRLIDMTGKTFGRLKVIKRAPKTKRKEASWVCRCECGNIAIVLGSNLRNGHTRSCGCLMKETRVENGKKRATHGMFGTRLYEVWHGMKARCYRPSHHHYKSYGGRGITVCDEWNKSFESFAEWANANGYDENAKHGECTIDRIDVDGNYEPSNCRFVDMKTQARNKRPQIYKTRPVVRIDSFGNKTFFDSATRAAKDLGNVKKQGCICACCQGKQHTAYGFKWRYMNEDECISWCGDELGKEVAT